MPERIGRYELVQKIATGGMAEVHRARLSGVSGFEKEVALKLILPHLADEPSFIAMFVDEAKLAAQLSHPNIVSVFDLGEVDGRFFIAMELVDGVSLHQLLRALQKEKRRLPAAIAVYIAAQALSGLAFAHQAATKDGKLLGIVHRDVSPHNVFISSSGLVKVGDFGIAKAASRANQTQAGVLKGKVRYMSPEHLGGKPVDARSDLFAMGAVLWEMLAGELLFDAEDDVALYTQVKESRVRSFPVDAAVPQGLFPIVARALQRAPTERYQSASEFARALAGWLVEKRYSIEPSDLALYLTTREAPRSAALSADTEPATPAPARRDEPLELMSRDEQMDLIHQRTAANGPSVPPWQTAQGAPAWHPDGRRVLPWGKLAALIVALGAGGAGYFWWRQTAAPAPPNARPTAAAAATPATPLPPGMGALTLRTQPQGLSVLEDGKALGITPLLRTPLKKGRHRLVIEGPDGKRTRDFDIREGEESIVVEIF